MEKSRSSPPSNPLDTPAWSALTTVHARLGYGNKLAVRYHPDIAPFAGLAAPDFESLQALAQLIPAGGHALIQTHALLPPMEGINAEQLFVVLQMVDRGQPGEVAQDGVVRLGVADADEMVQLALRTQPGPFAKRTHEMGDYIGLREGASLVAMAGERMRCGEYVEISAVCVDDEYRGRGMAARLMNILRHEIRKRGETPFLHVRDNNAGAIALYERLGFETRRAFHLYRVAARTVE